jgi:hypothetical protein
MTIPHGFGLARRLDVNGSAETFAFVRRHWNRLVFEQGAYVATTWTVLQTMIPHAVQEMKSPVRGFSADAQTSFMISKTNDRLSLHSA